MARFCDHLEAAGAQDPEFTLLRFLRAVTRRDWAQAISLTSHASRTGFDSRRHRHHIVRRYWQGARIEAVDYIGRVDTPSVNPEAPGVALTTITIDIQLSGKAGDGRWKLMPLRRFDVRLVRERSDGTPDPRAEWRVIPASLRIVDEQPEATSEEEA